MRPTSAVATMWRRMLAPTAAVTAGAALALAGAPEARAGTYEIDQCSMGGGNAPKGLMPDWSVYSAAPTTSCASPGGSFLALLGPANNLGYNQWAGYGLAVPGSHPNTTITAGAFYTRTPASLAGGNPAYFFIGSGQTGQRYVDEGTGFDHTVLPSRVSFSAGIRSFALQVWCSAAYGGADCFFPSRSVLEVRGARLTLSESAAPSGSIDGGSLVAGGTRRGAESLVYSAEDGDSGIARVQARLGATVVGDADFKASEAACPHDSWSACGRTRVGQEMTVDTSRLHDGIHPLSLRIEDAAGNARVVPGGQVSVDNVTEEIREVPLTGGGVAPGSPRPVGGTAGAGGDAPNGTNASVDARLVCFVGQSRATSARAVYGRPMTLRGRLTDPSGRPISGATLAVLAQVGRASMTEVDKVTTGADGRYEYHVPAGPSRVIRFAYRAFSADRTFASTSDVTLRVAAKASLRVTPRRVRNGRAITFRGQVLGGHLPSRGVHVDLQVKQGGWRTFGVARSDRRGRFSYRYRFTRTFRPTSYTFRAQVRGEAGVPYEAGVSNRTKVSVR
jgi:hypothetical protein